MSQCSQYWCCFQGADLLTSRVWPGALSGSAATPPPGLLSTDRTGAAVGIRKTPSDATPPADTVTVVGSVTPPTGIGAVRGTESCGHNGVVFRISCMNAERSPKEL